MDTAPECQTRGNGERRPHVGAGEIELYLFHRKFLFVFVTQNIDAWQAFVGERLNVKEGNSILGINSDSSFGPPYEAHIFWAPGL